MAKYIKFNELGRNAYEAPFEVEKDGMVIRGYNKESNESMLIADGWLKYTGDCPLQYLYYKDGIIHEARPIDPVVLPSVFTKLQIRRCLRAHDQEDELNALLSTNFTVQNEWLDAQEINLYDPVVQAGLEAGIIPSSWVQIIQSELSGVSSVSGNSEEE